MKFQGYSFVGIGFQCIEFLGIVKKTKSIGAKVGLGTEISLGKCKLLLSLLTSS